MNTQEIIGLYVAINLILHVVLMMRVGNQRMKSKISLGDGGDATLFSRIRAQGNFIENAPIVLISMFALGALGAAALALHFVGGGFTVSRLAHAHGMAQKDSGGIGRTIGAVLNLLVIVVAAAYLLYLVFT